MGLTTDPLAAEDAARVERKAADLEAAYGERLGRLPPRNLYPGCWKYVSTLRIPKPGLNVVFECQSPGLGAIFPAFRLIENEQGWHVVLNARREPHPAPSP